MGGVKLAMWEVWYLCGRCGSYVGGVELAMWEVWSI